MKISVIILFVIITSSQAANAQSITGSWAETAAECVLHGPDSPPIEVTASSVEFYETSCDLVNPTNLRGIMEGKLYDMQCFSEGDMWSRRAFIATNGGDGLIIYRDGIALTYEKC